MTGKKAFEKFKRFHTANPDVFDMFEHFTLEAVGSGMKKVGAKFVFERIRWELYVKTKGAGHCVATGRDLKLNNNFTPMYARMFMTKHKAHIGLFEIRIIKAK